MCIHTLSALDSYTCPAHRVFYSEPMYISTLPESRLKIISGTHNFHSEPMYII